LFLFKSLGQAIVSVKLGHGLQGSPPVWCWRGCLGALCMRVALWGLLRSALPPITVLLWLLGSALPALRVGGPCE